MIYYLILDKTNKVVCDFTNEEDAKNYVKARPYLRYEEFEPSLDIDNNDIDNKW